jgi:transposase
MEVGCGDGVRGPRRDLRVVVFVMITGMAWGHLPSELGCSGVAAWRRLRDWQLAGVWERLHAALLQKLNAAGAIDWSAAVDDGSHIRALQGGLDRAVSG